MWKTQLPSHSHHGQSGADLEYKWKKLFQLFTPHAVDSGYTVLYNSTITFQLTQRNDRVQGDREHEILQFMISALIPRGPVSYFSLSICLLNVWFLFMWTNEPG